ncbi:MAG: hypothetical protein GVY02_09755 [Bacteroidetes bacterium]|jgi:hypothetical protein|nr:hypothetical protein [Bacteroidota bacterium]
MTEEEARNQLMDYLYDEMEPDQKKEFKKMLEQSPELKKELNELKSTRDLIQSAPSEVPSHNILMMMPVSESEKQESEPGGKVNGLRSSFFSRFPAAATILTAAASLLFILIGAALTDLNMGQGEDGFYLGFGERTERQLEESFTREEVYELMEQMQQQNSALMATMVEELQRRQEEQLTQAVGVMADYVEEQRQEDLRLISRSLVQLQENTYNRFRQTDETLGDLIYAISYQQNQPTE